MPAWKAEPLITYPPMEEWNMFALPWDGSIQRVDGINMPKLVSFYGNSQPLTSLPWADLRNLVYLDIYGCLFEKLELWQLPKLSGCYASDNNNLIDIDAHDNTTLDNLDAYYCSSLALINLRGCTSLRYIYLYGCALPQAMIDQVLADLVLNGMTDGLLDISNGDNAAPSNQTGVALKNTLISRGWTVTTN